jgi:protein-tyrosine-phosphatase
VADCFLVSTGISRSFTEFDPSLVEMLVSVVRSYQQNYSSTDEGFLQKGKGVISVCFICEWNEGRSVHLELSTRHKLKAKGNNHIFVSSAGLRQGGVINSLRRDFLLKSGILPKEITKHKSTVFGKQHAQADLILVAELPMKKILLEKWPSLMGKVMTVKGFVQGFSPENEPLSEGEAHIEDAGGHSDEGKLILYNELEALAEQVTSRLTAF